MWSEMCAYILASVAGFSSVLAFGNPAFDGDQVALATRISGGLETTTALNPYVVYVNLHFPDDFIPLSIGCTGSIVHETVVLTAAHCVKQDTLAAPEGSYILVGALIKRDPAAINIGVKSVIPHPDYEVETVIGDIGIVFAKESLLKDGKGGIIPLASYPDLHYKEQVKLLGWGVKSFSGADTTKLLQCNMTSIPCRYKFGDPAQYFCTESYTATPLLGDSGGPVVTQTTPEKLIGVISGGAAPLPDPKARDEELFYRKCEHVSVAYYQDWIVDNFP